MADNQYQTGSFSPWSPVLQKDPCHAQEQTEHPAEPQLFPSALMEKESPLSSLRGCLLLQKFSVGVSLVLYISGGHRHVQSTALADVQENL